MARLLVVLFSRALHKRRKIEHTVIQLSSIETAFQSQIEYYYCELDLSNWESQLSTRVTLSLSIRVILSTSLIHHDNFCILKVSQNNSATVIQTTGILYPFHSVVICIMNIVITVQRGPPIPPHAEGKAL